MFITIIVVMLLSLTYYLLPEEIQDKIVAWLKDTAKWAALCGIVVAVFMIMFIFLPDALAEDDLPEGFYYRICFIDDIEELEDELIIFADDLDQIWAYYEEYPKEDEEFDEFDKDLSNIVLHFIIDNQLEAAFDKEERIIRGRIVVLTMWEATEDPWDDEVIDVYYSELVTDAEEEDD